MAASGVGKSLLPPDMSISWIPVSFSSQFLLDVELHELDGEKRVGVRKALLDSGAATLFISKDFVRRNRLTAKRLPQPIPLRNVDDSYNTSGPITHYVDMDMVIKGHKERATFFVANIGKDDIIIGIDWLNFHNPLIDFSGKGISFPRCPPSCGNQAMRVAKASPSQQIVEKRVSLRGSRTTERSEVG